MSYQLLHSKSHAVDLEFFTVTGEASEGSTTQGMDGIYIGVLNIIFSEFFQNYMQRGYQKCKEIFSYLSATRKLP